MTPKDPEDVHALVVCTTNYACAYTVWLLFSANRRIYSASIQLLVRLHPFTGTTPCQKRLETLWVEVYYFMLLPLPWQHLWQMVLYVTSCFHPELLKFELYTAPQECWFAFWDGVWFCGHLRCWFWAPRYLAHVIEITGNDSFCGELINCMKWAAVGNFSKHLGYALCLVVLQEAH